MNKKHLQIILFITSVASYQYSFAHGGGGSGGSGGSSSYDFDKRDLSAERATEKKAAEQKNDQDNWAEFMKAVNEPKTEKGDNPIEDHAHKSDAGT